MKKIFNENYKELVNILFKIKKELNNDESIKTNRYLSTYTDGILDWMARPYKEPILDDVERKYLSEVIKPFRKKVMDVVKIQYSGGRQSIMIRVSYGDCAQLPFFKNNTMYKGMEAGKYYTLQELGL